MIVKGKVTDLSGETLVGANVYQSGKNGQPVTLATSNAFANSTTTDVNGNYKLSVESGAETYITARFVGLEPVTKKTDRAYLDFPLPPAKGANLNVVEVTEKRDKKKHVGLIVFLSLAGLIILAGATISLQESK